MYNLCTYCTNKNRCKDAVKIQMNLCEVFEPMDTLSGSMMNSLEKQNDQLSVPFVEMGDDYDELGRIQDLVEDYMDYEDNVVDGVRRLRRYAETLEIKMRNIGV